MAQRLGFRLRLQGCLGAAAFAVLAWTAPTPALGSSVITLHYVGDIEGVESHAAVTYEDTRIQAGSLGWWAFNTLDWARGGGDGRIYVTGDIDTGVAYYTFITEVFGTSTFGYGDAVNHTFNERFRIYMEWTDAYTAIPLKSFDLVPNPISDGTVSYHFELTSVVKGECLGTDDCAMALATSLPLQQNAPDKPTAKTAKRLEKAFIKALKSGVKAAITGGKKQRKHQKRTRAQLNKLLKKARKADQKGKLGADLAPIENHVDDLLGLLPG